MADQITVSSTANPYQAGVYSAGSNSKNTMDVNSFIKLLAAQLSNQDMTSPMDNSEMMSQMTNMAMDPVTYCHDRVIKYISCCYNSDICRQPDRSGGNCGGYGS